MIIDSRPVYLESSLLTSEHFASVSYWQKMTLIIWSIWPGGGQILEKSTDVFYGWSLGWLRGRPDFTRSSEWHSRVKFFLKIWISNIHLEPTFNPQINLTKKGGFISKGFLTLDTLPTKDAKSCPWAENLNFRLFSVDNLFKFSAQGQDLATFVDNVSKVKKPSEIKPPLVSIRGKKWQNQCTL